MIPAWWFVWRGKVLEDFQAPQILSSCQLSLSHTQSQSHPFCFHDVVPVSFSGRSHVSILLWCPFHPARSYVLNSSSGLVSGIALSCFFFCSMPLTFDVCHLVLVARFFIHWLV